KKVLIDGERELTVLRNGEEVTIHLPKDFDQVALREKYATFYGGINTPTIVDEVTEKSNAQKAGLQHKDSIVSLNGTPTPFFGDFRNALAEQKNKEVRVGIYRNGEPMELTA